MSILRYIKTEKEPDFELLTVYLQKCIPRILAEQRGENLYYFWEAVNSSRGVDLSLESENFLEVRNTACSNEHDYEITNYIQKLCVELFGGAYYEANPDYDEDDENSPEYSINENPFTPFEEGIEIMKSNAEFIVAFIKMEGETISIYGPKRKINFGPYWLSTLKDFSPFKLARAIEKTIYKVNNTKPEYEYGNVIQMGAGENEKTLKLLANKADCILDKYDYILFLGKDKEHIAITNDDLNQILPKAWKRLDEYTIIAPILPENEFEILVEKAALVNRINEFGKGE